MAVQTAAAVDVVAVDVVAVAAAAVAAEEACQATCAWVEIVARSVPA